MERIAVIMAHSDDADIWCGGTLINHRDNNDKILICYLYCDNNIRKEEAISSAKKLNAETKFCSTELDIQLIIQFSPTMIITHWEKDTHFEHVKVFQNVNSLIPYLRVNHKLNFNLFSCDCYNSVGCDSKTLFVPTNVVDITNSWQEKTELIASYNSQLVDYWQKMAKRQNEMHGARAGVDFAEGFIQLPVLGVIKNSIGLLKGVNNGQSL